MLWLGSSLLLDTLCCVRFISMPKPLKSLYSHLALPSSNVTTFVKVPVIVISLSAFLQCMAGLMATGLLQGWQQALGAHTEKFCIILEVPMHAEGLCYHVICGGCCTLHSLRAFVVGRNNFPAKQRKIQHQRSGKGLFFLFWLVG